MSKRENVNTITDGRPSRPDDDGLLEEVSKPCQRLRVTLKPGIRSIHFFAVFLLYFAASSVTMI